MISSSQKITPLIGFSRLDALNFQLWTNQITVIATDDQTKDEMKRRLHNKYRGLFEDNQTIKEVAVNILKSEKTTDPTRTQTDTGTSPRSNTS